MPCVASGARSPTWRQRGEVALTGQGAVSCQQNSAAAYVPWGPLCCAKCGLVWPSQGRPCFLALVAAHPDAAVLVGGNKVRTRQHGHGLTVAVATDAPPREGDSPYLSTRSSWAGKCRRNDNCGRMGSERGAWSIHGRRCPHRNDNCGRMGSERRRSARSSRVPRRSDHCARGIESRSSATLASPTRSSRRQSFMHGYARGDGRQI